MKTAREIDRHSIAVPNTVATLIWIGVGLIGFAVAAGGEERLQPESWRGVAYASGRGVEQNPAHISAASTPEDSVPVKEGTNPGRSAVDVAFTFAFDARKPLSGDYEAYYGLRPVVQMFSTRHQGGGLTAGAGILRLESDSAAHRIANDPLFLDFGFFYRIYATPPHAFFRPYAGVHGNFVWMTWTYQDEVVGTEDIGSDSISGLDGCIAAGLMLNLTRNFHAYGEFGFGGITFLSSTHEDFENTFFDDFGYLSIKAGLGFSF